MQYHVFLQDRMPRGEDTQRREEDNVTTEAETWHVYTQGEEHIEPPEAARGKKADSSLEPWRENGLADTLSLDF